ncbi:MAG TPA: response regulator [Anaerolineae bacterium]|nr:response regulator [Anaerolineae bacterium]HMR64822.1 response regulator [Anaerolineae bacterium]
MTTHPNNGTNKLYAEISVLMVEDSAPQALKTKLALETIGCSVYWADNGTEGLAAALKQKFDLIVLDIELPDINGFEICKRLKANPSLATIPVVMLTTLDQAENVMHGLDAGAIDYIPKDAFADVVLAETVKQMQLEAGR